MSAAEETAFGGTDLDAPLDRRSAERRIAEVDGRPVVAIVRPDGRRVGAAGGDALVERRATGAGRVGIRLSDEQLTVATVAHELAHALAGVDHGHDATFRAAYVDVVAVLAGAASGGGARARRSTAMGVAAGDRRWPPPHSGRRRRLRRHAA